MPSCKICRWRERCRLRAAAPHSGGTASALRISCSSASNCKWNPGPWIGVRWHVVSQLDTKRFVRPLFQAEVTSCFRFQTFETKPFRMLFRTQAESPRTKTYQRVESKPAAISQELASQNGTKGKSTSSQTSRSVARVGCCFETRVRRKPK